MIQLRIGGGAQCIFLPPGMARERKPTTPSGDDASETAANVLIYAIESGNMAATLQRGQRWEIMELHTVNACGVSSDYAWIAKVALIMLWSPNGANTVLCSILSDMC